MRPMRLAPAVAAIWLVLSLAAHGQPPRGPRVPPGARLLADLEYARAGDKKLLLDLYLPEKPAGKLPVIVAIHGGGWAAGNKQAAQGIRLVERGYAVASIGYRLSGEAPFPAQLEDCKAAVRWLRAHAAQYGLDAGRFGAIGHSAGGHLASLLATTGGVNKFDVGAHLDQSSAVQAACPISGPTDFLQMDAHAPPGSRLKHDFPGSPESRLIGGPIRDFPDKVAAANPITYVSQDAPPFLLIHGRDDATVPAHQAELLHAALQRAGATSKLYLVAGAGHGVGGPEVNREIDEFFDQHLKSTPTR